MSGADILISLFILTMVGLIVRGMIKKHKTAGGCGCSCSGCGGSCSGHTSISEKKP